jgi:hypothetical protein
MQGTDVLHDSLLKNFSELKGTQAFFKKTKKFWPEKANYTLPVCSKSRRSVQIGVPRF